MNKRLTIIATVCFFLCAIFTLAQRTKATYITRLKKGNAVVIDPSLAYYKNRSVKSIASEVALSGFNAVHYLVLDEREIDRELIDELHINKIGVFAGFFATSIHSPSGIFPWRSKKWNMEFTAPISNSAPRQLSLVHPGYRKWMKKRLVKIFKKYPFDGFIFLQPHHSVYDMPESQDGFLGDVSPAFQSAFKKATGHTEFPNFTDSKHDRYYKTDTALFDDLAEFRVRTVIDFYDEIVNGKKGIRANFPDLVIGTETVATHSKDGLVNLRKWEAQDAALMVETIKPDIHFFLTHWKDLTEPNLPPDFILKYAPFFDSVKEIDGSPQLGVKTDLGSSDRIRKAANWCRAFANFSKRSRVSTAAFYEFSLRSEVYEGVPIMLKARRPGRTVLKMYFDQVLDAKSVAVLKGQKICSFADQTVSIILDVETDGNIVTATISKEVPYGKELNIRNGGISDDPTLRSPTNHEAKTESEKRGVRNITPDKTITSFAVGPRAFSPTVYMQGTMPQTQIYQRK